MGVGRNLSYCEESDQRCVSSQVQFDVFHLSQDKQYYRETVPKAVIFYLKWLLPLVCPSSIFETLARIKSLSFGLMDEKYVKSCINWIVYQIMDYSVTHPQRLYLCIILGHLNTLHFPLPLSTSSKMVETCDRLLQCLIACVSCNYLSTSDLDLLEKIAVILVQNSSRPGWLTLAANFYPYIGIEHILKMKNVKGLQYRYDDKQYHEMISLLLSNIKVKNENNDKNAHRELLRFMLEYAPTLHDASKLFTSPKVHQFFSHEDERTAFFLRFYKSQFQSQHDSAHKKSAGAQLVEFYKIPKEIREKMQEPLFLTLLKYSKSDDKVEEQHVNSFLTSILYEDDLDRHQVLEILMGLSKSKSIPRQYLLLDILNSQLFENAWHEIPLEDKVEICRTWVITRLGNEGKARSPADTCGKIAAVYDAINSIIRCYLNLSNAALAEEVSTYVVETFTVDEDVSSVLQAFSSIEKCVAVVQDCYKSHVRKILRQTPMAIKRLSNILKGFSKSRCAFNFNLWPV